MLVPKPMTPAKAPVAGRASLSLSAFRALGLGLTDLPEVTIYAN